MEEFFTAYHETALWKCLRHLQTWSIKTTVLADCCIRKPEEKEPNMFRYMFLTSKETQYSHYTWHCGYRVAFGKMFPAVSFATDSSEKMYKRFNHCVQIDARE